MSEETISHPVELVIDDMPLKERDLLWVLLKAEDNVVSSQQLLDALLPKGHGETTVPTKIRRLLGRTRDRLKDLSEGAVTIEHVNFRKRHFWKLVVDDEKLKELMK